MRILPIISYQNNRNNIQAYKTNPINKNQEFKNNNLPVYFSHPVAFGNLILDKDKKKALAGHEIYRDACKEIFKTYYASETPLILYKNGSNPEFICDTFKSMLAKNKFAKIGLQPKTTKVFLIDDFYGRMKKQKKKASKNESGETALAVNKTRNEDSMSNYDDFDKPTAKELILKGIVEEKTEYLKKNKDIKDIVLFVKDAEQVFPDNLEIGSVFDSKKHIKFVFLSLMPTDEDFVETEYPDSVLAENNLSKIMFYGMERSQAKEFFSSKENINKFFPTADVEVQAIQKAIDLTEDDESRAYPEKVTSFISRIIAEEQFKNDEADYRPVITEEMVVETYKANVPKEDEKSGGLFSEVEPPKVTFDDVGGMKYIKEALKNDVIDLIKAEDKQDLPKGVLLEGPPGTGKTLLAKAIAGEAKVPFIPCSGSDFVEVYVGQGAKRVRELFEKARELACKNDNKTAILFIDEIDAVAKARGSSDNDEREQTINAILAEMDGVKKDNKETHIIVLAATNRADMLDEAIVRPGRFDLKYNIPNPRYSESARYEIAKIHAKDKPFENEVEKEKIIKYIAQSMSDISGAEIEAILKMANRMIKRSDHKGPQYITIDDIKAARLEVLAGAKTDNEVPDFEIEQTIMHEAGHALNVVVLQDIFDNPYDKPVTKLDFITNEARKGYSGATYLKPGTAVRHNFRTIIQELAVSYGGASAERILYGANADGVGSDIDSIRENIEWAVMQAGLGPNSGNLNLSTATIQRLYAGRISADITLMQKLSQKISDMIVDFHKDFLIKYKNLFSNNAAMKIKLITSDEFKKFHADWLKDTGREKAYKDLQQTIKDMIENAQRTGIYSDRRRIGFDV